MFRVRTDNTKMALSFDELALCTDLFDCRFDFHIIIYHTYGTDLAKKTK
jgi:hypothetical protein